MLVCVCTRLCVSVCFCVFLCVSVCFCVFLCFCWIGSVSTDGDAAWRCWGWQCSDTPRPRGVQPRAWLMRQAWPSAGGVQDLQQNQKGSALRPRHIHHGSHVQVRRTRASVLMCACLCCAGVDAKKLVCCLSYECCFFPVLFVERERGREEGGRRGRRGHSTHTQLLLPNAHMVCSPVLLIALKLLRPLRNTSRSGRGNRIEAERRTPREWGGERVERESVCVCACVCVLCLLSVSARLLVSASVCSAFTVLCHPIAPAATP